MLKGLGLIAGDVSKEKPRARMTWTALPITSAGRLSPFSRSGILANLLLEGSTAQEGQNGDMSNL
jgi:hypothetical protein